MESDDLCTLKNLDENSLIDTLENRYKNSQIFTNSGLFLISINPYRSLDLFTDKIAQSYRENHAQSKPHIFSMLEQCMRDSCIYGEHTIIINGDSGAGKTECARQMLKYMEISILKDVDIILESLGNCKTILNDNSSRFGKLIRLNRKMKIETYLLERSRVTDVSNGERNFHIFYYILANRKESLSNDFINFDINSGIMNLSGDSFVSKFDETKAILPTPDYSFSNLQSLVDSYNDVSKSFNNLSIDFKEIEEIILGVMYMGSIQIENNQIVKNEKYYKVLEFLHFEESVFEDLLLRKRLRINGEEIIKQLSQNESIVIRNSLARLIYEAVFYYVVNEINEEISKISISVEKLNILDIFGFENFEENGLDQFCINWCNEHIHSHFVKDTFNYQKDLLVSEGVDFEGSGNDVETKLNNCNMENTSLDLIQRRVGITDLISEECKINGNASNLGLKLKKYLNLQIKPTNKMIFRHFNGEIAYSLDDFIEKNKEKFNDGIITRLFNTPIPFVKYFIKTCTQSQNIIETYKESLMSLMNIIKVTKVKYIKCVKPNTTKEPLKFDKSIVIKQLKSSGIFESVSLSKHLFPHMIHIGEFKKRYPFSDLNEPYLTQGKTMAFFNNEGLLDLEIKRSNYIEIQKLHIKSLFNTVILRKLVSLIVQSKKPMVIDEMKNNSIPSEMENSKIKKETIDFNQSDDSKTVVNKLRKAEQECLSMVSSIEEYFSEDIQSIKNIEESIKNDNSLEEENRQLKKIVCDLKNELKMLKQMKTSSKAVNSSIINNKFSDLINQESPRPERELERLQTKFKEISFSKEVSFLKETTTNRTSLYSIFKAIIQLFIENIPQYSDKKYTKDEIFSFSQSMCYVIMASFEEGFENSFDIFIEELEKQVPSFQENLSHVIYILNNLIELKLIFKDRLNALHIYESVKDPSKHSIELEIRFVEYILNELDTSIKNLIDHVGVLISETVSDILPYSILDYEPLKHMNNKKEGILKKIFSGPSIDRLIQYLEYFYNLCDYFYTENNVKMAIVSFALSSIDQITFNSLMTKRITLNSNKCYEIKYNLAEIEKFCFNIGFKDGFMNLLHMNEAMKIMSAISRLDFIPKNDRTGEEYEKEYRTVKEVIDNSFLTHIQINLIITKFDDNTLFMKFPSDGSRGKLISSPKMTKIDIEGFFSETKFVEPSYLPKKQLMKILKYFHEC